MVSKLDYDDQCEKVLKYIFGRTLICRNLEIATKMSQEYHLDCVTLDGDQVRQNKFCKQKEYVMICYFLKSCQIFVQIFGSNFKTII